MLLGYQNQDRQLGRLFELEKHGAKLVLMSALSQQPFTKRDASNGQLFYRPYDIDRLLNLLEVPVASAEPVMTHQFVLRFGTEEQKDTAKSRPEIFTLNGRPVFDTGSKNETSLLVGCGHFNEISQDTKAVLPNDHGTNEIKETSFFDLIYKISEVKSGCHHPDGILWFKLGEHEVHSEKVSILDVFPTLLDIYQIKRPNLAVSGRSLMPHLPALV